MKYFVFPGNSKNGQPQNFPEQIKTQKIPENPKKPGNSRETSGTPGKSVEMADPKKKTLAG